MTDRRFEIIDFLKGLSITGVVMHHLIAIYLDVPGVIKTASQFSGGGVHVFFVCSGFGLALSFMKRPTSWKDFIARRFSKIYIPYIIIVFLSFLAPYMYGGSNRVEALLSHVFLFKMFSPEYMESLGLQFWYLSPLFVFYLLFVILMKTKEKIGAGKFLAVSCVISIAWGVVTIVLHVQDERVWNSFALQYLWEIALGIYWADQVRLKDSLWLERVGQIRLILVTGICFCMYMVIGLKGGPLKVFNDVFGLVSFAGVGIMLYRFDVLRRLFCWMNTFSYELFLVHILVMSSCFAAFGEMLPNMVTGVLALALSIAAAIAYKKCILAGSRLLVWENRKRNDRPCIE